MTIAIGAGDHWQLNYRRLNKMIIIHSQMDVISLRFSRAQWIKR